jgi:hypothetical protein
MTNQTATDPYIDVRQRSIVLINAITFSYYRLEELRFVTPRGTQPLAAKKLPAPNFAG